MNFNLSTEPRAVVCICTGYKKKIRIWFRYSKCDSLETVTKSSYISCEEASVRAPQRKDADVSCYQLTCTVKGRNYPEWFLH